MVELPKIEILRLVCAGWWSGWTSATIARTGHPAPKELTPKAERRLGIVSLTLIAVGLISVIRLVAAGKPPASCETCVC
jgi:hypothetical protein